MANPDILHGWLAAQSQADPIGMDPLPGLAHPGLQVEALRR